MQTKETSPHVLVRDKGVRWLSTGHLWLFSSDVEGAGGCLDGDVVDVRDRRGRFIARGFFSVRSQIAVRVLTRDEKTEANGAFIRDRILRAVERRNALGIDAPGACRLVFSESDGLPGLIVDRYAAVCVVQSVSAGMDRMLPAVREALLETVKPSGILNRLDGSGRGREGLAVVKETAYGQVPELVEIHENGRRLFVDCFNGHKTGLYLDQRENHWKAAGLSRGKVLDAFCYQGAFSVHAAACAEHVTAVDSSPEAKALFSKNMEANGLANVEFAEANVFDFLRACEKDKREFDTVFLDPPSFARDKKSLEGALRGFKEINLRAMKLLSPGGRLLTYSCSHAMGRELFLDVLREAAHDVHRTFEVEHEFSQAPDHPVLLAMPETGYLKGFCLRRVD